MLVGQDTHWAVSLFRRMLPDGSTEPIQQGVTIVVVSICSMLRLRRYDCRRPVTCGYRLARQIAKRR